MSDPLHGVYRTREEVEEQKKRDPISRLVEGLTSAGVMDDIVLETLETEVQAEVDDALRFAEESPEPALETLESDVLAD